MPSPERRHHHLSTPLPPELAEFLKDQHMACLLHGSDQGTVVIIKAPGREIQSVRGRVPILLHHELYDHPNAPVLRLVLTIYDQPQRPLRFETFVNVGNEANRADFAALANQKHLHLLFYDEALTHRLTKQVPNLIGKEPIEHTLWQADRLHAEAIQRDIFDFDKAKQEVMGRTTV